MTAYKGEYIYFKYSKNCETLFILFVKYKLIKTTYETNGAKEI